MRAQAVYARDSLTAGARVLGAALAVGLSVEYVESWPDRIGAITAADVNAAARAVLKDSHSVTSLLLQKKTG
jgi:zinc protease